MKVSICTFSDFSIKQIMTIIKKFKIHFYVFFNSIGVLWLVKCENIAEKKVI